MELFSLRSDQRLAYARSLEIIEGASRTVDPGECTLEIVYVVSGSGTANANGRLLVLEAGNSVRIEPAERVEYSASGEGPLLVQIFGVNAVGEVPA